MNIRPAALLACTILAACPKTASTPTAGQLFAAYDAKTGADTYTPPESMTMVMKSEVQGQGIFITTTLYYEAPDHLLTRTEIPGIGGVASGYDGETAWAVSPMFGAKVLEGEERQELLHSIRDTLTTRTSELFPEATVIGQEDFHGDKAWKVDAKDRSGKQVTLWFSDETDLKIGSESMEDVEGEQRKVTKTYDDYTEHDGILWPGTTVSLMGPMAMSSTLVSIERSPAELPEFGPPEAVQALLAPAEEEAPTDETDETDEETEASP